VALDLGTLVGYLELDTSKWEGPLSSVGQKMPGWMAAAGATAAVALAAAFSASFVNAVNIDAGQDKIAAQLGLTEEESAKAGAAASAAYGNAFGADMSTVQAAVGGVIGSIQGMREASVEEIQGITEKVLTLADGFEIEADRISQVVGQMLSTGMASSAEEGLDLLTAALQKVPPAVREDIVDAVDEYGPFFQSIGMSGEEAMGALVAASEKGMYGIDKTGDAVKEFGIRATDMSAASVAAYEAAGLNAEEMSAKILAGGDTAKEGFQQIIDGLLGIEDPVARSNAAIGLFGTPLEDLGVNEIPTFLASLQDVQGGMGDVAGSAQAMADTMGDNVASKWTALQRTFEGIMTTVAAGLLPVLEPLLDWIAQNPIVIQALVAALAVLTLGFIALTVATWAMNTALLANPITWIVLAIIALIAALVLLVMNWDQVVAWITDIWGGFISWLTGVMDGLIAWWNEMWAGFGSWVQEVWTGFTTWVQQVFEGFVGWLTGIGDGIASWWNGLWAGIGNWIRSVWEGFVGFVRGVFIGYYTWLIGLGAQIVSWWNGLWSGIGNWIRSIWTGFVGFVQGVAEGFLSFIRGAFEGFVGFWSGLWGKVKGFVESTWNGLVGFVQGIPNKILSVFANAGEWLINAGKSIIQGFIDGITGMIGAVGDAVGGVMDFVAGFFPNSPAKRGPFSGSGWTRLLGSGAAIMDQFADGMHSVEPFSSVDLRGTMFQNGALILDAAPDAAGADLTASGGSSVFHYHAAENQSLSDEEALFAALGSPRSPFGGK
jgi:TP901 family phage tail tape measure protein